MSEESKKSFFARLDSHYAALEMVKDTAKALYFVAGAQAVSALIVDKAGLVDALINAACAFGIGRYRSRIASGAALLLAVVTLLVVMFRLTSGGAVGGIACLFALLAAWAGARALEATIKLRGRLVNSPSLAQDDIE
ncbi:MULTISPECIES: hypothetical protein [unclassified Variovorax]|uniref:hypothetical protein n=1 Tax=unclassified Variovorax TaxID=663243 RepID=UPI003F4565C1